MFLLPADSADSADVVYTETPFKARLDKFWSVTARLHGRLHILIAVDECVCMTVRLCASMTMHAANVCFASFQKCPCHVSVKVRICLVGRIGSGVRVSATCQKMPVSWVG